MNPVIGIIGGNGRMGRLFADFFREKGLKVLISDIGTKFTNKKLVQESDIVIISVPIDKTIKVIKEVLPYMKATSAIMDF
ncbi:MAG: prephenate dehydrogenase/arogenate dehydrogenase family protein, partial [Patescibacteria group bacterium]